MMKWYGWGRWDKAGRTELRRVGSGRSMNQAEEVEILQWEILSASLQHSPQRMSGRFTISRVTRQLAYSRSLSTATAAPTPAATLSAFDSALSASSSTPLPSSPSTLLPTRLPPPPSLTPSTETALLQTLARLIMKSGKLPRAHTHLATCLTSLSRSTSSPPVPILQRALEVVSPSIRVVGRRKGTKSLPTPQPLTEEQRRRQAWKWIVEASDKRQANEKVFGKRLAQEVLAVLAGQSEAIKKKEARCVAGLGEGSRVANVVHTLQAHTRSHGEGERAEGLSGSRCRGMSMRSSLGARCCLGGRLVGTELSLKRLARASHVLRLL